MQQQETTFDEPVRRRTRIPDNMKRRNHKWFRCNDEENDYLLRKANEKMPSQPESDFYRSILLAGFFEEKRQAAAQAVIDEAAQLKAKAKGKKPVKKASRKGAKRAR